MIADVSALALYIAIIFTGALTLMYALLQPWWRSWFGCGMILTLTALLQMLIRAVLAEWFGEDYPGDVIITLIGRVEIAVAMSIATFVLGGKLLGEVRHAWGDHDPPAGTPREHEYT